MIAIVNVGLFDDDHAGVRDYEVRINSEVKCRFKHKRSDGLEVCLRKAADAVRDAQWREVANNLEWVNGKV